MAHRRSPLVRALQLNTAVLVVEIAGGVASNSFSLIMDGTHCAGVRDVLRDA